MKDVRERLRDAVVEGQSSIVRRILRRFPNHLQNVNPVNGWSSLHYAGYYGHYMICVHLVNLGHDKNEISLNFDNNSPLHTTVLSGNHQTLLMILQSFPQCINMKGDRLRSPLHFAAMMNYNNCVDLLIDKGANVNAIDADGNTPLHLAMMYGSKETIRSLLTSGAYFDIRNIDGWLPVEISRDIHTREWFTTIKKEIMLGNSLKFKQSTIPSSSHTTTTITTATASNPNASSEFKQPISNIGFSSVSSSPNSSCHSVNNESLPLGAPNPSFDLKNILSPTFPDSIPPANSNASDIRQRSFSFNKKTSRPFQKSMFIDTSVSPIPGNTGFTSSSHIHSSRSNTNICGLSNVPSSTPASANVEKFVIRSSPNTPISINAPMLKNNFPRTNHRLHSNSLDSTASTNTDSLRIVETPPSESRHRLNTAGNSVPALQSYSNSGNSNILAASSTPNNQADLYNTNLPVSPTSPISQVVIKPTGKQSQQLLNTLNNSSSKNLQNMINGRYRSNTVMSYNSIISGESLDTNYSPGTNNNIMEGKNLSSPYAPISSQINFTSMKQRNESPIKKQNSINSGTSLKSISDSSKNISFKPHSSISASTSMSENVAGVAPQASSPFKNNEFSTTLARQNRLLNEINDIVCNSDNDSGTDIDSSYDDHVEISNNQSQNVQK